MTDTFLSMFFMVFLRKGKMYFGFLNYNRSFSSSNVHSRNGSHWFPGKPTWFGFLAFAIDGEPSDIPKKGRFLVIFSRNTEVVINFSFTLIDLPQFHQIVRFWSHASVWLERLILVKNRVAQLRLIDHVTCNVTKSALRVKYERSTLHTVPKVHILT